MWNIYKMWKMTHLLRDTEQSRYKDDVMEVTNKIKLIDEFQRPGLVALGILEEWAEKTSMTKKILRHSYVMRYYLEDDKNNFDPKNPKVEEWAEEARKILNLCLSSDNGYIGEDSNRELVHLTGRGDSFTDNPIWKMFGFFGPKISVGLVERYWKDSQATRVIIWSIVFFFTSVVINRIFREQLNAFFKFWGF